MKNLTYRISLLILGLFAAAAVNAQEIRGVVSDVNGDPLIGVSVFVDGTTLGTATEADGGYAINIPSAKGKTLVFSMIGLSEKRVIIGNSTTVNVTLEEDTNFLDETVVIGYATVRRRDLMGSVTSVGNETLTQVPVSSVGEALAGKMAGVQVTATEGDPDAEIKIRVRGGGSITQDSSPLYIVDGFPVSSISDIPASDIQSIDVLKDAFSTAIYGSRGANGVVLVTTKSGASGKISVSYNAYWGQKTMANADAIQTGSSYDFVQNRIKEVYFAVQKAWADGDMKKAEDMVTEALFRKYQKHLDAQKRDGEKNVMEDIVLKSATPVYAKDFTQNEHDYLWVKIEGSMVDYVILEETGYILEGTKDDLPFCEYWRLTRRRDGNWVLAEIMQEYDFEKTKYYKGLDKL